MITLRSIGEWVLVANLIEWLGAGTGRQGTPPAASPLPRRLDDDEHVRLTEREREIELRILMSNWM
jgi:hypothetical protein